jgi:hypothetical protein
MKSLWRKFVLWLMQTTVYRYLITNVVPYIRFTTYYTSLRGWKYFRGYKKLEAGDIVLTLDRKKLTSMLIPGEVTHAALCVAKNEEWEIAEMTHSDFCHSNFFDICKESDRVVILRCKDWDEVYTKQVIEKCKTFKDAKYDIEFGLGIKSLYCSELVYQADFERRLEVSTEDLAGIGRQYISPAGLLKALNCDTIWDSDDENIVSLEHEPTT